MTDEELEDSTVEELADVADAETKSGNARYRVRPLGPVGLHARDTMGEGSPGLRYTKSVAQIVWVPSVLNIISSIQTKSRIINIPGFCISIATYSYTRARTRQLNITGRSCDSAASGISI
jgi:hypothetical protein